MKEKENSISGCQDCQCSKSGSIGNECNQETGQCSCKPGLIGRKCDKCPPKSIRFVKGDDDKENQKWLYQFDYEEGCFSCLSIQECNSTDQKGCPDPCIIQLGLQKVQQSERAIATDLDYIG